MKAITLEEVAKVVDAEVLTAHNGTQVGLCYQSDLLSDVLAHAKPNALWLTVQIHRNVVSVASMKDISAILITGGRRPAPAIIAEAEEEGVAMLCTPLSNYEAAGRLWAAGLTA
jgi:predicted transcriptional regulator